MVTLWVDYLNSWRSIGDSKYVGVYVAFVVSRKFQIETSIAH